MDLWNHVICHYYILHLRLSVCCCRSVMCSNRYKYFDHLKQLSHVEQFVHQDTGSGPKRCTRCENKKHWFFFIFLLFYLTLSGEKKNPVSNFSINFWSENRQVPLCYAIAPLPLSPNILTWNELFLLNVTIFSTLPKRWNIWCRMSNETGYNSDSTITRKTVFWPPVVDIVWWTPCDTGSVPDIGRGEPDAGDVTWKSWLCNATDAF